MGTTKIGLGNNRNEWNGVWKCRNEKIIQVKENSAIGGGRHLTFDYDGTCFQGAEWDLMERLREGGETFEKFMRGEIE